MHDRKQADIVVSRHQKKEIDKALNYCWDNGMLVVEIHRAHRWGRVVCPGCGGVPKRPIHPAGA